MHIRDLEFHGHSYMFIFSEVLPGRVQRPITYVRGARDDFMVPLHDVNSPQLNTRIKLVQYGLVAHSARKRWDGSPPATWQLLLLEALQNQLQLEKGKGRAG